MNDILYIWIQIQMAAMQYHYLNFLTTKLCCWFSQSQSVRDFGTILNIYSIICSHRQPLSIFYFSIGWSNSMGKYMVDDNNNSFRIWYRGFWSGVYFFSAAPSSSINNTKWFDAKKAALSAATLSRSYFSHSHNHLLLYCYFHHCYFNIISWCLIYYLLLLYI